MSDTLQSDLAAHCMRLEAELSAMTQRAEAAEAAARISSAENVVLKKRVFQAEAKSKALPEGWQLVPKMPNEMQLRIIENMLTNCCGLEESYHDILDAATQPESDIDQARKRLDTIKTSRKIKLEEL